MFTGPRLDEDWRLERIGIAFYTTAYRLIQVRDALDTRMDRDINKGLRCNLHIANYDVVGGLYEWEVQLEMSNIKYKIPIGKNILIWIFISSPHIRWTYVDILLNWINQPNHLSWTSIISWHIINRELYLNKFILIE